MEDSFMRRLTVSPNSDNGMQPLDGNLTIQNTGNYVLFVGQANAPITIINGTSESENNLSEQEAALLEVFKKLDLISRAHLIAYAVKLASETS